MKPNINELIETSNHQTLLKIQDYSREEQKELAKFFSEGSKTLELALKTLWNKKLYTNACCKGHLLGERHFYFSYMYSYISFENGIDVFKYLSDELVNNPYVQLLSDQNQSIYFYGKDKEKLMLKFIKDIMNKQEVNSTFLKEKLNNSINHRLLKILKHDYYIESGFTEEEYQELESVNTELLHLDYEDNYTSVNEEEYDDLLNRTISIKNQVYQRKMSKRRKGRK